MKTSVGEPGPEPHHFGRAGAVTPLAEAIRYMKTSVAESGPEPHHFGRAGAVTPLAEAKGI
jgi:hypothetical protein